ncbi:uroporphyrinogen-III C-methyltransferase [Pseudanabaena sp. PCC 6802]|uniref:uroporphyrinogen-III C-methyltransferase n=1 Tax=Pseudanabaena sp. PCC 6802 TaxID=118173 RepID=UPI00034719D1|nr:uroporphyrinogen-III C-methyltransferase [Pseudanabaena sp. PCC 6802]
MSGKVYIVGAGVGGIEYLTLRAQALLSRAETVIYDALADEALLDLVPETCDRIYVGKRGGKAAIPQPQIDALLVRQCLDGKQVVRLKSGDPLIFGRAVSELQALVQARCEFELVPGISSAIAAPLFAGIPLTDAEVSSCFAVFTGHDLEILPWDALASIPTLVILMGTANLSGIIAKLQFRKPPNTDIAVIQWCGRTRQQIWTGTLSDIHIKLPDRSLSPAVIAIGAVVKHHAWMHWYKLSVTDMDANIDTDRTKPAKPLDGKRILVTRAAGQSGQFAELLVGQGAQVIEMPTLAILPPTSWEKLDAAIAAIDTYDWLILTSANAVESFFQRLRDRGRDVRALAQLKIAVVGRKTADLLAKYNIIPDLIPPDFIADALVENFPPAKDLKILFPRVQSGGREVLVDRLAQQGAIVDAVPAYESGCPEQIDPVALEAIQAQQIDVITFASSKTVKHFHQLLSGAIAPEIWQTWIANVKIASIGPQTSATCIELLGRVDIEAGEYTLEGLTEAISNHSL